MPWVPTDLHGFPVTAECPRLALRRAFHRRARIEDIDSRTRMWYELVQSRTSPGDLAGRRESVWVMYEVVYVPQVQGEMFEVEKTYWSGPDGEVQWHYFKTVVQEGIRRARPSASRFHIGTG